ncbi:MAG: X2-like carbohydrate binding domain-containing protein, partial [Clostridia bacterium]
VMVPPDWEIGDIVTLKFDYKYEQGVGEPNNIFNIAFTGAQNKPNHEINLSNIGAKTGGDSRFKWDITSSALTGARADWKHVEVTFVVDSQFKIQCDSLRFLMNISGDNADDVAYFDNVGMYTWAVKGAVDETPVISGEKSKTFTKSSPADISFTIDTKGNTISSIKRGTSNLNASAFTATETSFTLKKEYLSTLDVGTHTFTVNTLGGTVNFTIVVEQGATGCCSSVSVLGMGLMLVALFGVVAIIIAERKHSKKA